MQIPCALHKAGNGSSAASPWQEEGAVWLTSIQEDKRQKDVGSGSCKQGGMFWGLGSQRHGAALAAVYGCAAIRPKTPKQQGTHLSPKQK